MTATSTPSPDVVRAQRRRAIVASTVGTTIEWYDFFLYGTAAALVFPDVFFPAQSTLAGILLSFGTQFVGFAARPVGAAIFGHYGDRHRPQGHAGHHPAAHGYRHRADRRAAGVRDHRRRRADAARRSCGSLQGIGVGGEWGGSVLISMEWGSRKRRGFMASLPQLGVPMGLLLSTGAVKVVQAPTGADASTPGAGASRSC